jgi:hypothetical protein
MSPEEAAKAQYKLEQREKKEKMKSKMRIARWSDVIEIERVEDREVIRRDRYKARWGSRGDQTW